MKKGRESIFFKKMRCMVSLFFVFSILVLVLKDFSSAHLHSVLKEEERHQWPSSFPRAGRVQSLKYLPSGSKVK
jgi:hypothetical protein